ncbi:hypothetical protein I3842_09G120400 [Carya illinoinensis]|uniref:G domain-containing protein n=1 Tax=Carya illinoinensis TaxID=32201 RepID=A0A922E4Z4_CARIL|nr:hypothetical protein I3842_09G120400 [Carya illinoinensis]
MRQAGALLVDEDVDETPSSSSCSSRRASTFLNVVALGNVGVGKSAVLNSLIGYPVLGAAEIVLARMIRFGSHSIFN